MNSPVSSETDAVRVDPAVTILAKICEKHGDYESKCLAVFPGCNPVYSGCPACNAEYMARKETENLARQELSRRDAHQRELDRLFGNSGIPSRFVDRTFETFKAKTREQEHALTVSRRLVESVTDESGASVIFTGRPGTGKTHLACAAAQETIRMFRSAAFITVSGALRKIKDTYRRDSEISESEALDSFLLPDLLILDEVGAQTGSEHEKTLMFEIINERYQNCRSTILISNLTIQEISQFLGDRVIDRFRESGAVIAFNWESYRGKKAA